jgi:hypothetical protein
MLHMKTASIKTGCLKKSEMRFNKEETIHMMMDLFIVVIHNVNKFVRLDGGITKNSIAFFVSVEKLQCATTFIIIELWVTLILLTFGI